MNENPTYILRMQEEDAKFWIDNYKTQLQQIEKEYNTRKPTFDHLESEYLSEKDTMDKLKDKLKRFRAAIHDLESLKKLDVTEKKKSNGLAHKPTKILKRINWKKVLVPILEKENRFIDYKELFKMAVEATRGSKEGEIENNSFNTKRLMDNACKHTERLKAGADSDLYFYKGRVGLAKWAQKIDTDLLPKKEFYKETIFNH